MLGSVLDARVAAAIAQRREQDRLRQTRQQRCRINFGSNDYLGLRQADVLKQAATEAIQYDAVGAGAAQLLGAYTDQHAALEQELAGWLKRDSAILFSTGYMANLGIVQALLKRGDVCIQDKQNHASLLDAVQLSGARLLRYPHLDAEAAGQRLAQLVPDQGALLATDGVFSMDGSVAPLTELRNVSQSHDIPLMVDDAHGLGVLGKHGRGASAEFSQNDIPVLVGTFGKALGGFGAFVAGDETLMTYLRQFARSYIYTTALPVGLVAAMRASVALVQQADHLRADLKENIQDFHAHLQRVGLAPPDSQTPIQFLPMATDTMAVRVASQLAEYDIYVAAIRPPTAPQAGLRISLSAAHTATDIAHLVDHLATAMQQASSHAH